MSAKSELKKMRDSTSTLSETDLAKCDLPCTELLAPEFYGSEVIPTVNLLAIENRLDQRIIDAMDTRNFMAIMEARRERNCFYKWRDKCVPTLEKK